MAVIDRELPRTALFLQSSNKTLDYAFSFEFQDNDGLTILSAEQFPLHFQIHCRPHGISSGFAVTIFQRKGHITQ